MTKTCRSPCQYRDSNAFQIVWTDICTFKWEQSKHPSHLISLERDLQNLHPAILINPTEILAGVVPCNVCLSEQGSGTLEDYQASLHQIGPASQSEGGILNWRLVQDR